MRFDKNSMALSSIGAHVQRWGREPHQICLRDPSAPTSPQTRCGAESATTCNASLWTPLNAFRSTRLQWWSGNVAEPALGTFECTYSDCRLRSALARPSLCGGRKHFDPHLLLSTRVSSGRDQVLSPSPLLSYNDDSSLTQCFQQLQTLADHHTPALCIRTS